VDDGGEHVDEGDRSRPDSVPGQRMEEIVHFDDSGHLLMALREVAITHEDRLIHIRLKDLDGCWTEVRCLLFPLQLKPPTGLGWDLGADRQSELDALPDRQSRIVEGLLQGDRVPAIAAKLYLSKSTIHNHLTMIFERFGVKSQVELLTYLRGTT
jgi:DNA-binding CsgD family transcriptional regulator